MKVRSVSIIVRGRVQGVGFRRFAQRGAEEFGVLGWTRNLDNGDVEIMAESEEESLEKYLVYLKKGPALGRVDEMIVKNVENETRSNKFQGFMILPDGSAE